MQTVPIYLVVSHRLGVEAKVNLNTLFSLNPQRHKIV